MAQAADSGSGSFLQNKNVQIGVLVAGGIAVLVILVMYVIMPMMAGSDAETALPGGSINSAPPPGGAGAGAPTANTAAPPPTTTPSGAAPPPTAGPGTPPMPVGTPTAAPAEGQPRGPKPEGRANPFAFAGDLKAARENYIKPPPPPPGPPPPRPEPPPDSPEHDPIYYELNPPRPEGAAGSTVSEEFPEPPIPRMRVVGILHGNVISAIIEIDGQVITQPLTPGKTVRDFRVERIEPNKVVLSRRYDAGGKSKQQFIDVVVGGAATSGATLN